MKKYNILVLITLLLFITSIGHTQYTIGNTLDGIDITQEAENARLESMTNRYFSYLYDSFPEEGTRRGLRDSNKNLSERTMESNKKRVKNLSSFLKSLKSIDYENLSVNRKIEYDIIKNKAELVIFEINKLGYLKKNPYIYINAVDSIYDLYMDRGLPKNLRSRDANNRVEQLPEILKSGKQNLYKPSHFLTSIAIKKAKKAYDSIDEIEPFLRAPAIDDFSKSQVSQNLKTAKKEIADFQTFLAKDSLSQPDTDYRLGESTFMYMLEIKYHTDISAKKLEKMLEDYYFETKENLLANIRVMLDIKDPAPVSLANLKEAKNVSLNYPKEDQIIPTFVRIYNESLEHFKSLNILPEITQNIKLDTPPSYYKSATNPVFYFKPFPFYNVGDIILYLSLPESFKNEENKMMAKEKFSYSNIKVIIAKYMMPGTHLKNSYGSKARIIKMSDNDTMINGWQLYSLHLADEFGLMKLKTEKFYLALEQYTIATRALTSFKLQTKEFSSKDAIGFLQSATVSKPQAMYYLEDIALNPVKNVSYVLGYEDILEAREEYEEKFGLLWFHETLLDLDNIPSSYIENEMKRLYKKEKKNRKN